MPALAASSGSALSLLSEECCQGKRQQNTRYDRPVQYPRNEVLPVIYQAHGNRRSNQDGVDSHRQYGPVHDEVKQLQVDDSLGGQAGSLVDVSDDYHKELRWTPSVGQNWGIIK